MVRIKRVFVLPDDVLSRYTGAYRAMTVAKDAVEQATKLVSTLDPEKQIEVCKAYLDAYHEALAAYYVVKDEILLLARQAGYNPATGDQVLSFEASISTGAVSWMHMEAEVSFTPAGVPVMRGPVTEDATESMKLRSVIKTASVVALDAVIAAVKEGLLTLPAAADEPTGDTEE